MGQFCFDNLPPNMAHLYSHTTTTKNLAKHSILYIVMTTTFNYWSLVLDNLRTKVSASNFQSWFSVIDFDSIAGEGRKVVLTVPSEFHRGYITKKFSKELQEAITKYYPKVIHVDFKVHESETKDKVQEFLDLADTTVTADQPAIIDAYLPAKNLSNLNPKYTFENFVVTRNYEFVYQVANGVINEPGTLYSPLFVHSPVGLGKTHLLQSIGHKYLEKDPTKNIKYIPAETLFNQFYHSLAKKEVEKFREYYSSVDLLLIDDIQFIGGKEAFQEIFFHLFNTLHQANKQIIITSDKSPKDLIGVADRLVSRFESGLVTDIPRPDIEDRITILKDKAARLQLSLTPTILRTIAERVVLNVRELEGALNKIKALMVQDPAREITTDMIARIFPAEVKFDFEVQVSPDKINHAVCKVLSVSIEDMLGTSRERNTALARQISFYLYKTELNLSFPLIGKLFGGKDHSTVMHGYNKVKALVAKNDTQILSQIEKAKQFLTQ
jgi:chromosomal replication initiator protein